MIFWVKGLIFGARPDILGPLIPQTCVSMRGSDIDMVENWVHLLTRVPGRGACLRQPSRRFGIICQNLSSRPRETQNFAPRRGETPCFELDPKLPQTLRPRNIFGHFGSKIDPKSTEKTRWHVMFSRTCIFSGKKETAPPPKHMGCLNGPDWRA